MNRRRRQRPDSSKPPTPGSHTNTYRLWTLLIPLLSRWTPPLTKNHRSLLHLLYVRRYCNDKLPIYVPNSLYFYAHYILLLFTTQLLRLWNFRYCCVYITVYINTAERRDLLQKPALSWRFCKDGVFSKDCIFVGKNGVFSGIVYNLTNKANPV